MNSIYYRNTLRRENVFKLFFLSLFSFFSSYPRLLLEVFIRKNFGQRYFRLSSVLTVAGMMGFLPRIMHQLPTQGQPEAFDEAYPNFDMPEELPAVMNTAATSFWGDYWLWYLFLALFLVFSVKHAYDQRKAPSVFECRSFSLYSGKVNPLFYKINILGFKPDIRMIECYLEPLLFLVIGIILALVGQALGWVLIICSIFYSMNYISAYYAGDNFIMDKIDEIICNEELENTFLNDKSEDETRGFRVRAGKPDGSDYRKKLLPLLSKDATMAAD